MFREVFRCLLRLDAGTDQRSVCILLSYLLLGVQIGNGLVIVLLEGFFLGCEVGIVELIDLFLVIGSHKLSPFKKDHTGRGSAGTQQELYSEGQRMPDYNG